MERAFTVYQASAFLLRLYKNASPKVIWNGLLYVPCHGADRDDGSSQIPINRIVPRFRIT